MPTVDRTYVSTSNWTYQINYYLGEPYYWVPATADYDDHTHGYAWNDVQRRVKPAPLWSHQTDLTEQYTEKYTAYICDYLKWGYSGPISSLQRNRHFGLVKGGAFRSEYQPDPDWQTRMRLQIKDLKVNLGESVVEYRQSARMFGDFAKAATDAWRVFKGKNISRRVTPCSVNSAYLMTTYGLNPLANTLYDSLEVLYHRLGMPVRKKFISTAQDVYRDSYTNPGLQLHAAQEVNATLRTSKRAIAYVTFNTFGRSSALSFGNPLQLAWELVPYSFVLDWALPIGDYLSALDALTGCSDVKGSVTTKKSNAYILHPIASSTHDSIRDGTGSFNSHSRFAIGGIPLPALPRWKPSPSWHKVRNGMALILNILQPCNKGRARSKSGFL